MREVAEAAVCWSSPVRTTRLSARLPFCTDFHQRRTAAVLRAGLALCQPADDVLIRAAAAADVVVVVDDDAVVGPAVDVDRSPAQS